MQVYIKKTISKVSTYGVIAQLIKRQTRIKRKLIPVSLSNLKDASACSLNTEDVEFLNETLEHRIASLTLFYRGSIDGWMRDDFHFNCDDSGPTISLF
jgi:hypothetical protein